MNAQARATLIRAVSDHIFPAAAVDVGSSSGSLWSEAFGTLTFDRSSAATTRDTLFDLASLTKVVATTTLVMDLVHDGRLRVDERVADGFAEWRGADRDEVVLRDLLEHASGLPARLVDAPPNGRREFEHEICRMALEYPPRSRSIYSDLDFILLGFVTEDRMGASLVAGWREVANRSIGETGMPLTFEVPLAWRVRTAPTSPLPEDRRRGRPLIGEVHDNYAAALGGGAGHAGLFGTAPAVGAFARLVLRAARGQEGLPPPFLPELIASFTTKTTVPGSSRTLGWDTMLPTSSCGTRMSTRAFGHVGFTGTSLWIDPLRDRYFVLLTNRAYAGGTSDDLQRVRRQFHDALGDE